MTNKLIAFALAFLLLLNLSSAFVSFYQDTILHPDNAHLTRTANSVFWVYGWYGDYPNVVRDEIKDSEILEVEIDYSMYLNTWNTVNTGLEITNCTLTINYFSNNLNQSYIYYEETVTANESDVKNKKYFVRLPVKDGISTFMDCYYANESKRTLLTPTELSIKLPTYECKSCQYYQWSVQQRQIVKAEIVGNNLVSVWTYMKKLVVLNFEILVALFWFLMILILLVALSLIFLGIYYLFIFLKKLATEIR
jgi:hypothetical protein